MAPIADYATLLRQHFRFLSFGFLMAFTSSAGQTYFVGIFGPHIQQAFSLSHTRWSSIYLLGTLASAALLPWTGQWIDRLDLKRFSAIVVIGLALACLGTSLVVNQWLLILAIFGLRHFGQGLSSHVAQTSMARYMGEHRGKSLAISSMGYSTGEALLPLLAVMLIAALGWRMSFATAAGCVLALLPLVLWSLSDHKKRHRRHLKTQKQSIRSKNTRAQIQRSVSRDEMLRDPRFYLILPAILIPSYIATALFFHHLTLADSKAWSALWITGNYWIYALVTVLTSLAFGPLVDRYTAVKIMPFYLAPLCASVMVLVPAQHAFWVIPYMILMGINIGIFFTAGPALWAELYGPMHLGSIKSTIVAFNVFASALGPVTIGLMLDHGYRFEHVSLFFALVCIIGTLLLIVGLRQYTNERPIRITDD